MTKHTRVRDFPQARRRPSYLIGATLEEVFRSRFTPAPFTECWEWQGYVNSAGYGKITHKGKTYRAHRLAWQFFHGMEIPDGMVVCHRCDNPRCVNPYHLELGTQADNMTDKAAKGRQHRGENHPRTAITENQVRQIRAMHNSGLSTRKIAQRLNVSTSSVGHILRGNSWRHVT